MEKKKHILMVDDAATNLKCAGEVLKEHYTLSMAKSGKQALSLLERIIPNLILLDINMPEMNGYETMKKIREIPECKNIPIVFLTADSDLQSEIKSLDMGAMDYIRKPFEPDLMLSRISRVFRIEEDKKVLEIKASKDVLTNLWNRKHMEEYIDDLCLKKEEGIFLLMDLDNFKGINDSYGHIVGDEVLNKFATAIKEVALNDEIVCRLGGDEFATFYHGKYEETVFKKRVEELILSVEALMEQINIGKHNVSVSIGIAIMPSDGNEFKELYNKADKALYYVKQNGKCGYHLFNEKEKYLIHQKPVF